jgi:hypothetical protein
MWTDAGPEIKPFTGLSDFLVKPPSYESDVCIIRGQGEGTPSVLERLASGLLIATEALADEDIRLVRRPSEYDHYVYVPTIVTAAALKVGIVDVSTISLATGMIDACTFKEVPLIRFRKSLAVSWTSEANLTCLTDINRDKQRTVLVVNADHLETVLEQWNVDCNHREGPPPWVRARQR